MKGIAYCRGVGDTNDDLFEFDKSSLFVDLGFDSGLAAPHSMEANNARSDRQLVA